MSRFSPLFKRLCRLEPDPKNIEPWPPVEGSFLWAMLEGMKAEGIKIPDKPSDEPGFMFLARLEAPRLWAEEEENG
jgi:hypothetical protein